MTLYDLIVHYITTTSMGYHPCVSVCLFNLGFHLKISPNCPVVAKSRVQLVEIVRGPLQKADVQHWT